MLLVIFFSKGYKFSGFGYIRLKGSYRRYHSVMGTSKRRESSVSADAVDDRRWTPSWYMHGLNHLTSSGEKNMNRMLPIAFTRKEIL